MALTMEEIEERNKRIESFDLVRIMFERCKIYQNDELKAKIINMYDLLPQNSKICINRLVRKIYFIPCEINSQTINNVISNKIRMENIVKIIECEILYNKKHNINLNENIKDLNNNNDNLLIATCWNCNSKQKRLMNVTSVPIFCFACGRYYQNGKEISIEKLNGISNQLKRSKE